MRSTIGFPSLIACNLVVGVAVAAAAATSPATRPATQPIDPAARAYSDALDRLGGADARLVWETVRHDLTGIHLGNAKITPPLAALLARHEKSLELMRRGAREPRCDWGQLRAPPIARALLNATTSGSTTQPATTRAAAAAAAAAAADRDADDTRRRTDSKVNAVTSPATLTFLAALRAQQLIEQGQPGEAAMWLADAMAVTRQMTSTEDWGMFSTGLMLERAVTSAVAEHLLDVPQAQLEQLKTRLASLPPPRRLRDLMGRQAEETARSAEQLRAELAAVDTELAAVGPATTTTQVAKAVEDTGVGMRAVVEAMSVPPDDAMEKLELALEPLDEADKRLWRSMTQTALKVRIMEAAVEAQRPMLLAAIDIALRGADAVRTTKDPFAADGASFDYRPMGAGFQLLSQLTIHRKPVSLEVGDVRRRR